MWLQNGTDQSRGLGIRPDHFGESFILSKRERELDSCFTERLLVVLWRRDQEKETPGREEAERLGIAAVQVMVAKTTLAILRSFLHNTIQLRDSNAPRVCEGLSHKLCLLARPHVPSHFLPPVPTSFQRTPPVSRHCSDQSCKLNGYLNGHSFDQCLTHWTGFHEEVKGEDVSGRGTHGFGCREGYVCMGS